MNIRHLLWPGWRGSVTNWSQTVEHEKWRLFPCCLDPDIGTISGQIEAADVLQCQSYRACRACERQENPISFAQVAVCKKIKDEGGQPGWKSSLFVAGTLEEILISTTEAVFNREGEGSELQFWHWEERQIFYFIFQMSSAGNAISWFKQPPWAWTLNTKKIQPCCFIL